jgi:enoyl-CoA hydratase/carnithine racemase
VKTRVQQSAIQPYSMMLLQSTGRCSQFHRFLNRNNATHIQRYFASDSEPRVTTTFNENNTICYVQLNRPEKMNALDIKMFHAIQSTARSLRDKPELRAIILSGKGRAFCTGLDVPSLFPNVIAQGKQLIERPNNEIANLAQDIAYCWRDLPVPVIASLHGMCFGGGMQLALGADLRYASPDCRLSIMESKWGLIPDMSASVTLREVMRIDVAKELTMTGRILNAHEAMEYGLVTRVVDDPLQEAEIIANEICKQSPDSVGLTKKLYQETWVAPEAECLRLETKYQRRLLASWNQLAKSARNFGWNVPYKNKNMPDDDEESKKN